MDLVKQGLVPPLPRFPRVAIPLHPQPLFPGGPLHGDVWIPRVPLRSLSRGHDGKWNTLQRHWRGTGPHCIANTETWTGVGERGYVSDRGLCTKLRTEGGIVPRSSLHQHERTQNPEYPAYTRLMKPLSERRSGLEACVSLSLCFHIGVTAE